MSVLNEYSDKLYSMLLDNYGARKYFDQPVYLKESNGKFIPASWLSDKMIHAEALAGFIADMQSISLKDSSSLKRETMFFLTSAHIMYIPFGEVGYAYLKKVVKERFDKEIGQYLYEQFVLRTVCPLNGSLLKDLNEEQKEYIKDFFMSFSTKDEIICSNPKDIAIFVGRLYFALYGIETSSYQLHYLKDKYFKEIDGEIHRPLFGLGNDEICRFKLSDYIHRIPKHKPLNSYEENFILEKFNLL